MEGGPEGQAENVQDTLYHMHLPCGEPGCLRLPADQMTEEREITAADSEIHTSGTSQEHCPTARPARLGGLTAAWGTGRPELGPWGHPSSHVDEGGLVLCP